MLSKQEHIVIPNKEISHSVTMTAELTDIFKDREEGVKSIIKLCHKKLGKDISFYNKYDSRNTWKLVEKWMVFAATIKVICRVCNTWYTGYLPNNRQRHIFHAARDICRRQQMLLQL